MSPRQTADILGEVARRTAADAADRRVTHPVDLAAHMQTALDGAALALVILGEEGRQ